MIRPSCKDNMVPCLLMPASSSGLLEALMGLIRALYKAFMGIVKGLVKGI